MSDRTLQAFTAVLPGLHRPAWRALTQAAANAVRAVVTRRALLELEPRLLADIGLTRGEALAEAARAPWDVVPPRRWPPRGTPRPGMGQRLGIAAALLAVTGLITASVHVKGGPAAASVSI